MTEEVQPLAPAAGIGGLDVSDAIGKAKYALNVAQLRAGQAGLPYKLGSIDLELKVVQTRDVTGKPVFKVPVLDWEIGGQVKISDEQTQVLSISLAPPAPTRSEVRIEEAIDMPITDALLEIAGIIRAAATGDPKLMLGKDGASVKLQFAFTADGTITLLIFEGHMARATTSSLTVTLVAT